MLNTVKNFNANAADLDTLVDAAACAASLIGTYQALAIDAPDWLTEKSASIQSEIKVRVKDEQRRRLLDARSRRAALATAEEKRGKLDEEIARLEALVD